MPTKTSIFGTRIRSGSIPPSALSGGVVSSSAQITALLPSGTLSSSAQVNYSEISNIPSGIVSSSAQVKSLLPVGSVSSSTASSPSQGTVRVTINGVNTDVDTGLQTGDSPTFSGLTVDGTVTAKEFYTQVVSSSIIYQSGSTKFGDSSDDVMSVTGSIAANGNFIISSSGNVGIGTTTPGTKLDVSGNIRISGNGTLSGYGGVEFANVSGFGLKVASLAYEVNSSNGTTNYATINSSGNVGIGTGGNISSRLHVSGTAVTANSDYGTFTVEGGNVSGLTFGYDSSNNYSWIYSRTFGVTSRPLAINGTLYVGTLNGSVGIGTSSPSYKLDVSGSIGLSGFMFAEKLGNYNRIYDPDGNTAIYLGNTSDPTNYYDNSVHVWRSRSSVTTYAYINSAGNFGIGTTSPQAKLDVVSTVRTSRAENNQYYSDFITNYNDVTTTQITTQGTAVFQAGSTDSTVITAKGTNKHIILTPNGTGGVGIGTTTPSQKLQIVGTLAAQNGVDVSDKSGVRLVPGLNSGSIQLVASDGSSKAEIRGYDNGSGPGLLSMWTANASAIPTERMRIDSSGNVGIGTTSPIATLHVSGSDTGFRVSGTTRSQIMLSTPTTNWQIETPTSTGNVPAGALGIIQGGVGTRFVISGSGNVGIGTTTPASKLEIAGGNLRLSQGQGGAGSFGRLEWQNALAYSSTVRAYIEGRRTSDGDNGFIDFATSEGTDIAPVVRMTISRLGDIGIGTTSPSYTLHTVGRGYFFATNQDAGWGMLTLDYGNGTNGDIYAIQFKEGGAINAAVGFASYTGTSLADLKFYVNNGSSLNTAMTISGSGNVYTAAGSSISYGSGETYIIWSSDSEVSAVSNDANWKNMKTFVCSKSGTLKFKFSGYIASGTFYWAWRILQNGTNVVASGHFNSGLDTGETASVHAYRRFVATVGPIAAGDSLVLQMMSADGGGTPTTGNGQTLYAKEFRAYSTVPNVEHGGSSNIWGENVGIGTTSPSAKLDVNGNNITLNLIQDYSTYGYGDTKIFMGHRLSGGDNVTIRHDSTYADLYIDNNYDAQGGTYGRIWLRQNISGTMTTIMSIRDQKVGIGTSSPTYKLDVIGNMLVQGTQGFNATDETATLYIGDSASAIQAVFDRGMLFYQNGTERMRIQGVTGNVGIGTTSPVTKLEISDIAPVLRISGVDGSKPQLQLSSVNVVNWALRANFNNASDFTIYQDSTERVRIDSSGNLSIGAYGTHRLGVTVSPGADREILICGVDGASNGFRVQWKHSTAKTHVSITDIPTSSAGLPAGTIYSDGGTLKIA